MAFFKTAKLAAVVFTLSACSNTDFASFEDLNDIFRPSTAGTAVRVTKGTPEVYKPQKQEKTSRKATSTQVTTKRINTTQCRDSDDWYLDGYRVGKSFSSQKQQMLQERMSFCHMNGLASEFKQNWERGFTIGMNENRSPKRKSRKI